ncbi:MAG: NHLP leader peptide family RiPP precursor [Caldilineaceae bacterium]
MTNQLQARDEIEALIRTQAERDPAYRQWLLQDPKAAVADFLGVSLPPGMSITVLEEQPGQHYLVLPPPPMDALPLDDLELALVGGGRTLRPVPIHCDDTLAVRSAERPRTSC